MRSGRVRGMPKLLHRRGLWIRLNVRCSSNVRRSSNVEVCNFVVTGTVAVIDNEIGIRASEIKWRDGRNLADEKVRRASETRMP